MSKFMRGLIGLVVFALIVSFTVSEANAEVGTETKTQTTNQEAQGQVGGSTSQQTTWSFSARTVIDYQQANLDFLKLCEKISPLTVIAHKGDRKARRYGEIVDKVDAAVKKSLTQQDMEDTIVLLRAYEKELSAAFANVPPVDIDSITDGEKKVAVIKTIRKGQTQEADLKRRQLPVDKAKEVEQKAIDYLKAWSDCNRLLALAESKGAITTQEKAAYLSKNIGEGERELGLKSGPNNTDPKTEQNKLDNPRLPFLGYRITKIGAAETIQALDKYTHDLRSVTSELDRKVNTVPAILPQQQITPPAQADSQLDRTRKAAETSDPKALFDLARRYLAEGNNREAINYYRKAADLGYARAQYDLGVMYFHGDGVPPNDKEAVKWWEKAAQQGLDEAQNNLALMYHEGRGGLSQNPKEEVALWKKAADQGLADGQFNLANRYLRGEDGLAEDVNLAVMWYQKAAKQGHAKAQEMLRILFNPK